MARIPDQTNIYIPPPPPIHNFRNPQMTKSPNVDISTMGYEAPPVFVSAPVWWACGPVQTGFPNSIPYRQPATMYALPQEGFDGTARGHHKPKPTKASKLKAPSSAHPCDLPPLAVYHICRICLRPRSATYHRENPIPINGVPPPPGICRRCRIATIEEVSNVADVVRQHESYDINLGIKCLVPDSDIFTNEEMRAMREKHRSSPNPDKIEHHQGPWRRVRYVGVETERTPSRGSSDRSQHFLDEAGQYKRSSGTSYRKSQQPLDLMETERYAWADFEVRRIAREEVSRYREAERKIEAHPSPFAHGRMIPIKNIIEDEEVTAQGSPTDERTVLSPSHPQPQKALDDAFKLMTDYSNKPNKDSGSKKISDWPHASASSRYDQSQSTSARVNVLAYKDRPSISHTSKTGHSSKALMSIKLRDVVGIDKQMTNSTPSHTLKSISYQKTKAGQKFDRLNASNKIESEPAVMNIPPPPPSPSLMPQTSVSNPWSSSNDVKVASDPEMRSEQNYARFTFPDTEQEPEVDSDSSDRELQLRYQAESPYPRASTNQTSHQPDDDYLYDQMLSSEDEESGCRKYCRSTRTGLSTIMRDKGLRRGSFAESLGAERTTRVPIMESRRPTHREYPRPSDPAPKETDDHGKHHSTGSHQSRPPYPSDDVMESIQMPSPSAHSSHGQYAETGYRSNRSPEPVPNSSIRSEQEVDTSDRPTLNHSLHDTAFGIGSDHAGGHGKSTDAGSVPSSATKRWQERALRAKGELGHVRFSTKVDVSPTPPGSDASSAQFRGFGRQRHSVDGRNASNEAERRGRSYNRDRRSANQHHPPPPLNQRYSSETETPRPVNAPRERFGSKSEPDGHRYRTLGYVLSESPSREYAQRCSRALPVDGKGPYRQEVEPSMSVIVEDGSEVERTNADRKRERAFRVTDKRRSRH